MRVCQSCGGIIGRDCFNTMECTIISHREESYKEKQLLDNRGDIERLYEIIDRLVNACEAHGVDVSWVRELDKPKQQPVSIYSNSEPTDDLPF